MEILGLINFPGWVLVILAFIFTICLYTWYKQTFFTRHGIRQKQTTFLLGDLPTMAKKGFHYIDADLVKQNGKVFGAYMGNFPSLIIADTEIIKQILVKDFPKFIDRPVIIPIDEKWKPSVSVANDDHWKFLRSTLSPIFSSVTMRYMSPYINKCLGNFLEILEENRKVQGEGFDIAPIFRGYTMDVICTTGFGIEVDSLRNADCPFVEYAKRLVEIEVAANPAFALVCIFPELKHLLPKLVALTTPAAIKKAFEFFKSTTETAFKERKIETSKHKDLLHLLINAQKETDTDEITDSQTSDMTIDDFKKRGLTDTEVLVNSIIFMLGGYDTTATTLFWLAYDLSVNPDVQEKLIAEIDAEIGQEQPNYDTAFKLKYLDMVISETLRMHPPNTRVNRIPCEDIEICGVKLKKGVDCAVPVLALHYMPEFWEAPTTFNPERFAPENQSNINKYAYLPFGIGPRHCLGMKLALLELRLTLITLLQKYKIVRSTKLAVPMPIKRKGFTYKPAEPILVRLEPR